MDKSPAIIFEDNHLIVVIKPCGVPSQPDASGDLDMLTMLKEHRRVSENKLGEAFVGLIHRLDRVTGGVMVFAKTSKSASRLSEQMRDGGFSKKYLAIVQGVPRERTATLEHYLLKNERTNRVDIVGAAVVGAKRAELSYNVRAQAQRDGQELSLVEINLVTGRSHQIRVQLAKIGHSIVGDCKYRSSSSDVGVSSEKQLALWANELAFNHPTADGQMRRMRFQVNPPEEGVWDTFDFNRKSHKTK